MAVLAVAIAIGALLGHFQTVCRNKGYQDPVSLVIQRTVSPLARPLASSGDAISEFGYGLFRARKIAIENDSLKARLNGLQLYSERIDLMQEQIDELRRQIGLGPLPGHERLNLQIVGFAQIEGLFTLNGGTERGIQPNMPVINGSGLVGIVQTVSSGQCQAALLTTYGVKIGGIDISRKPPERGLLSGGGSPTLSMRLFDPKASIASGDRIVSGGLSERIPYGLIIGRVISVEDDAFGTRLATISPAVNVGTLREVQVLK